MDKLTLLSSIHFGDRVAETESDQLAKYFVETGDWRRVYDGTIDIIYGPKGAGKSAIYSLLYKNSENLRSRSVNFVPAENPRGQTAFSEIVTDPPTTEAEFVQLWKLYILSLIGEVLIQGEHRSPNAEAVIRELRNASLLPTPNSLRETFSRVYAYVRRMIRPNGFEGGLKLNQVTGRPEAVYGKISFETPSPEQAKDGVISLDTLLQNANAALSERNEIAWVAFDRLDVAFAENASLEANALRALFKVYLGMQHLRQIRLKIFLRSDIWRRITQEGFREASHITRSLTLSWNGDLLMNLVMRRLLQSELLCHEFDVDATEALTRTNVQHDLFYRVFPDQVDVGAKKPSTFDWIITRTRDGTGHTAPREVIHLMSTIAEIQIRKFDIGDEAPPDENLFSRTVIKEALGPVSEARLEQTLYAEYPNLKHFVEQLEGEKATQSIETLARIWSITKEEARQTADRLVEVGFFELRGTKADPDYWIPFLYRDALSLVQGAAE